MKKVLLFLWGMLCPVVYSDASLDGSLADPICVMSPEKQNAHIFDVLNLCDDFLSKSDKKQTIYGLRIQLENDSAQVTKKEFAYSDARMRELRSLSPTEQEKRIEQFYQTLDKRAQEDPVFAKRCIKGITEGWKCTQTSKPLCDPEAYDKQIGGFLTAFYIPGTAPLKAPIVMVHGGPGGSSLCHIDDAVELAQNTGRSILVYTQRGCAGSSVSFDLGRCPFEQSAEDLDAVIAAVKALSHHKNVILYGHSFGPAIINYYTATRNSVHSKSVLATIQVAPASIDLSSIARTMIARQQLVSKYRKKIKAITNTHLANYMINSLWTTQYYDFNTAVADITKKYCEDKNARQGQKMWFFHNTHRVKETNNGVLWDALNKECQNNEWEKKLRTISTPSLIVHGAHDSIPLSNSEKMMKLMKNAQLKVIPKSAHSMFVEQPKAFYKVVTTFLNALENTQCVVKKENNKQDGQGGLSRSSDQARALFF
jgi:pimeloyl-ACP methyl ester carboxylesterase